jgi:hypothetical protein
MAVVQAGSFTGPPKLPENPRGARLLSATVEGDERWSAHTTA